MVHRGRRADPIDPAVRAFIIVEAFRFIGVISSMVRIQKIALVTRDKLDPKDADVLVTVADHVDLTALATESRKLKGRTRTKNRGADIFFSNPSGHYISRVCHWKECAPGICMSRNA